jgi:hypothetical protein
VSRRGYNRQEFIINVRIRYRPIGRSKPPGITYGWDAVMIGLYSGYGAWVIVAMRSLFPALFLLALQLLVCVITGRPVPGLLAAVGVALITLTVGPFTRSGWSLGIIYTVVTVLFGLLLTGGFAPEGLLETISEERWNRVLDAGLVSALGALLLGWAVLLSEMLLR